MEESYEDRLRRSRIADSLDFPLNMGLSESRRIANQVHGGNERFAVPVYDSRKGRYIYFPRELCKTGDEAFEEAMRNLS